MPKLNSHGRQTLQTNFVQTMVERTVLSANGVKHLQFKTMYKPVMSRTPGFNRAARRAAK